MLRSWRNAAKQRDTVWLWHNKYCTNGVNVNDARSMFFWSNSTKELRHLTYAHFFCTALYRKITVVLYFMPWLRREQRWHSYDLPADTFRDDYTCALFVRPTRLVIMGDRAFSVAGVRHRQSTLEQFAVRDHLCSHAACFLQPSKDVPVSTFLPSRLDTFYPRPPVV